MATDDSNPVATVLIVAAVAAGAALLVSASYEASRDRIAANERARLVASLNSVLDPALRERDLRTVRITAADPRVSGGTEQIDVLVMMAGDTPVATVFASIAPDGYNASIRLLIGIDDAGTITGVRAVAHRETPGLGDRIDVAKSDWIEQFAGKSLAGPPPALWAVDDDDGAFDALTGATITSRAVVNAVRNTLLYFAERRDELYAAARAAPRDDEQ